DELAPVEPDTWAPERCDNCEYLYRMRRDFEANPDLARVVYGRDLRRSGVTGPPRRRAVPPVQSNATPSGTPPPAARVSRPSQGRRRKRARGAPGPRRDHHDALGVKEGAGEGDARAGCHAAL